MGTTTTTNFGLTKPNYNEEAESWGTEGNTNMDLIDAALAKMPIKLLSGTQVSQLDLDLALSSAYARYRLELTDISASSGVKLFARFSNGAADPVTASNYDYAVSHLSAKSSGTQTFAAAASAAGIFLTDNMLSGGNDTDYKGVLTLDIAAGSAGGASYRSTAVKWDAGYFNSDGSGYWTRSSGAGALRAATSGNGRSTKIKIGGYISDYTAGFRCSYALYGIPGLA